MADESVEPVEPKTQTDSSRSGGGRLIRTAVGTGGGGRRGGGGWYVPRGKKEPEEPGEPGSNAWLKNLAIDALSESETRDYADVFRRIRKKVDEYKSEADQLADTLARLVVSAYVVAEFLPCDYVIEELRYTFACFSDAQLVRILGIASEREP